MNIVDCRNIEAFENACNLLSKKIVESGERYDLFVPIANGGEYVSDVLFRYLNQNSPRLIVKRQRRTTKGKQNIPLLRMIVKLLPTAVQDFLRKFEIFVSERKFEINRYNIINSPDMMNDLRVEIKYEDLLISENINKILVIDDCVDSGSTLSDVRKFLYLRYPNATIHNASLALTHRNPLIFPEYLLFERTIIKCPWSLDG